MGCSGFSFWTGDGDSFIFSIEIILISARRLNIKNRAPIGQEICRIYQSTFFLLANQDDLDAGAVSDAPHRLEVTDLHGSLGTEDVCGLPHEFGGFDVCLCRQDLGF